MENICEKERTINIRDMFFYMLEKAVIIALVSVIFMVIAAGLSYKNQKVVASTPGSSSRAVINTIIAQNKAAYYAPSTSPSPYSYAELPGGACNSTARIYIDYNYDNADGKENIDFNMMTVRGQSDAAQLVISDQSLQEIIDELDLHSYNDMSDITTDELRWLICCFFDGAGMMQVNVTDTDPQRANRIAESVVDKFINNVDQYSFIDHAEVVDWPTLPKGNAMGTPQINKKEIIKKGCIGFLAGFVLMAGLFFLFYIFSDSIRSLDDLEYIDSKCFGVVPKLRDKRLEEYKRIAYNIALLKDTRVITFVPTDYYSVDNEMIDQVVDELKSIGKSAKTLSNEDIVITELKSTISKELEKTDYILMITNSIKEYAKASIVADYSDKVIIMSRFGRTKITDISVAINEIEKTSSVIAGVIVCGVRRR